MQIFQSSLKVFLLIGMAFWLAGCLPVEEEEEDTGGAPATSWYEDTDGDTYGDPATEFVGDQPDLSWVTDNTDCDDMNANANPAELEIADRVDNECKNGVDDGFKYAFVTSSTHTGKIVGPGPDNLVGLAGADAICDSLADVVTVAVPLPLPTGEYVAWLSSSPTIPSSLTDARDRVTNDQLNKSTYVNTGGVGIALEFEQLVDGGLDSSISFDESGTPVAGVTDVWTDTGINGLILSGESCLNWTSLDDDEMGLYGSANNKDAQWTALNLDKCDKAKRLYCIQK